MKNIFFLNLAWHAENTVGDSYSKWGQGQKMFRKENLQDFTIEMVKLLHWCIPVLQFGLENLNIPNQRALVLEEWCLGKTQLLSLRCFSFTVILLARSQHLTSHSWGGKEVSSPTKQFCHISWLPYNVTEFNSNTIYLKEYQIPQIKLSATTVLTTLQAPIPSLGCHCVSDWRTINQRFPTTPLQVWSFCYSGSQNSGKHLCLPV